MFYSGVSEQVQDYLREGVAHLRDIRRGDVRDDRDKRLTAYSKNRQRVNIVTGKDNKIVRGIG